MTPPADVALVLIGHGSGRHPDSAAPLVELARSLGERGWRESTAVFMKQEPGLDSALKDITAERVALVPVFAGKGYYTDTLIPRALGLTGPVTRRNGRSLFYAPPVGTHPRIPLLLADRAELAARSDGADPAQSSLLMIAHGSARPGGSAATPRAVAQAIADLGRFAEVSLVFLEQAPFAGHWRGHVRQREVVALPLLIAQGTHASEDVPPLFNLGPGERGPVEVDGHRVRLTTGLGTEPALADIVTEMALASLGQGE